MRLNDTQQLLETALRQSAYLNSLYHGDPYDQWNNAEVGYVSACYELQQVETTENTKRYHFIVYVADRLTEDGSEVVYSKDWKSSGSKTVTLPVYKESDRSPNQAIMYVKSNTSRTLYGRPMWSAGIIGGSL